MDYENDITDSGEESSKLNKRLSFIKRKTGEITSLIDNPKMPVASVIEKGKAKFTDSVEKVSTDISSKKEAKAAQKKLLDEENKLKKAADNEAATLRIEEQRAKATVLVEERKKREEQQALINEEKRQKEAEAKALQEEERARLIEEQRAKAAVLAEERKILAMQNKQIKETRRQERNKKIKKSFQIVSILIIIGIVAVQVTPMIIGKVEEIKKSQEEAKRASDFENELSQWTVITEPDSNEPTNDFKLTLSSNNISEFNKLLISMPKRNLDSVEQFPNFAISRNVLAFDASYYTNLDVDTSIIYPGAIIVGESLNTSDYVLVTAPRKPIEIVSNFSSSNKNAISRIVDDPKLSTVSEAINSIVDNNIGRSIAANIEYYEKAISNEQDITVALGVTAKPPALKNLASVEAEASVRNKKERTHMLVKFTQIYYTISVQPPKNPSDFFANETDMSKFNNVSPAYVSDVSYGRIGILDISAEATETEISAAIKAELAVAPVGGEVSNKDILRDSSTSMTLSVFGGNSDSAVKTVSGYEGFIDFIKDSASDFNNAKPIRYNLRYVSDNKSVPAAVIENEKVIAANPKDMKITLDLQSISTNINNGIIHISVAHSGAKAKKEIFDIRVENNALNKQDLEQFDFLFLNSNDSASIEVGYTKENAPYTSLGYIYANQIPIGASQLNVMFDGETTEIQQIFTGFKKSITKSNFFFTKELDNINLSFNVNKDAITKNT